MKKRFFVSLLAVLVLLTMSASSFAFAENYSVGKTYSFKQDSAPEAPEGYKWEKVGETAGYYDIQAGAICGKTQHTHSTAENGCMPYTLHDVPLHVHDSEECYTTVQTCTKEIHKHNNNCYWTFIGEVLNYPRCGKEEHKSHTDSCFTTNLTCEDKHTEHSAYGGSCYIPATSCSEGFTEEHTHTVEPTANAESCYNYIATTYQYKLVKDDNNTATNGNMKHVLTVNVKCVNNKAASGVSVKAVAHDITASNAEVPTLTQEVSTNVNGVAQFNISSTYNYVDVFVNGNDTATERVVFFTTTGIFTESSTVNAKLREHIVVIEEAEDATCTQTGKTEGQYCSACGDTIVSQEVVPALGHDLQDAEGLVATCTTPGFEAGKKCSRCDYTEGFARIPETGHKAVTDPAVAATCGAAGKTEGSHCEVCGTVLKAQEDTAATGNHTWGAWGVNPKDATQEIRECSVCHEVETRTYNPVIVNPGVVYPPVVNQNDDEPVDIIDVDAPAADTPDEVIDGTDAVDEEGVYTDAPVVIAPAPEEEMDIMAGTEGEEEEGFYTDAPEEDVPASDVPKTGDAQSMAMWMILALAAALGLGKTAYARRK